MGMSLLVACFMRIKISLSLSLSLSLSHTHTQNNQRGACNAALRLSAASDVISEDGSGCDVLVVVRRLTILAD